MKIASSKNIKKTPMKKGEYKQWSCGDTNLTLFRDSKFVYFIDNCFEQNKLGRIYRRKKGRSSRKRYIVPYVIQYYNNTMGSVDAANSRRKNHMIGTKHVRKNNRCYLGLFDQVVLQNAALMYAAYKGWKRVDQTTLRIQLCKDWVMQHQLLHPISRIAKSKTINALGNALRNRGYATNHVHRLVHIGTHRTNRIR